MHGALKWELAVKGAVQAVPKGRFNDYGLSIIDNLMRMEHRKWIYNAGNDFRHIVNYYINYLSYCKQF